MMKKTLFIILIILCGGTTANAQLNNNFQRGTGMSASGRDSNKFDRMGNPIDTTAVNDASTVPIGLFSWKVDERLGNVYTMPVDTVQAGFMNTNYTGGMRGHYTYLGNLGSPRIAHVYFDRKDPSQIYFTDPYDFTVKKAGDVVYTNTLSPFANLTYYKQGDGRYGEERFKSYFATNVNKRLGFGFDIDYTYGRGKYMNQSTALFNGNLFAYYRGDKYDMHFNFVNDNLKVAENGGLQDDRYVTHPLEMAGGKRTYRTYEMPTNLANIWNHNTGYHAFLTHRYNLGFYDEVKDEKDTLNTEVFVPVTSIIHTMKIDMNKREYVSYDHEQNLRYFEHNYLGSDSTDVTKHFSIKNTIGLSLREGFNKYAKAGLTAFASFEHRKFNLVDSIPGEVDKFALRAIKENNFSVGGQLIKEKGKLLHYQVFGEAVVAGEDAGQFIVEGKGDLNFRLWKDTVRLEVNAHIKNLNPTFYHRHFHSKHYWWDNDLSKITSTKLEGKFSIDRWKTMLKVGVENIKNYTYLDNASVGYDDESTPSMANHTNAMLTGITRDVTNVEPSEEIKKVYKNDARVQQHSDNIQVLSATLQQDFHLGIFHLDNEVTFQKSSNEEVLPLPKMVLYHNLYIRAALAKKVLSIDLGADVRYFSQYYAPDYSPAIGQYYLQNHETRYKLGGYPMVNAYVNLHLKRTRIFVQMYNLLQKDGDKSYFYTPHYALNPRILKIGISWNFFD